MSQEYNKEKLVKWYNEHRNSADRVINDLAKQTCEGIMHVYAYTAKFVGLEHVVSQQDFPTAFSNNYTRVGDTLSGIKAMLLHEWNIRLGKNTLENTLTYWLLCGNMYEVLVAKIITKSEDTRDRELKHTQEELANRLANSSIQNGIKTKKDWAHILSFEGSINDAGFKDKVEDIQLQACSADEKENDVPQIPPELNTERGLLVLQKAIKSGLCDEHYHWRKSKTLLAYFAQSANDELGLSNAMQDGEGKISWKPFEQLFHAEKLKDCRNNYRNKTGKYPKGFELVDQLFSNLSDS